MIQLKADFCVVGAGYAGLAAAYRLHRKGHSVIVLEAGAHPGGRVWTEKLSDGTAFDIGGAWVAQEKAQPDIRRLMRELKIETYPQFTNGDEGKTTFVGSDGKVSTYTPLSKKNPLAKLPAFRTPAGELDIAAMALNIAAQLDLASAITALNAMSAAVNREAPWEDVAFDPLLRLTGPKTTREADTITIQTWLDLNMSTADAKTLLTNAITGVLGVAPAAASLLHFLFMLKTFQSSFSNTAEFAFANNFVNMVGSGEGEAEQFRVDGGAQAMAVKIADLLKENLYLRNPVRQITQHGRSGVTVSSENVSVRARRVIVATGTAMANFLRFDPPLPAARALLQQRMPQGEVWKIWLCYDRAWWRDKKGGLNGESISIYAPDFVANSRDAGVPENRPGLMNAFVAADRAREFAAMGRANRKKRVIKELVHRFGPEAAKLSKKITFPALLAQNPQPDSYFEWDWAQDEFTRGDYAAVPGPGVLTAFGFGPAMREPVGNVYWASVDLATYPYASFSGAVQSGERAAQAVMED
jgi:monoamine oxidase